MKVAALYPLILDRASEGLGSELDNPHLSVVLTENCAVLYYTPGSEFLGTGVNFSSNEILLEDFKNILIVTGNCHMIAFMNLI